MPNSALAPSPGPKNDETTLAAAGEWNQLGRRIGEARIHLDRRDFCATNQVIDGHLLTISGAIDVHALAVEEDLHLAAPTSAGHPTWRRLLGPCQCNEATQQEMLRGSRTIAEVEKLGREEISGERTALYAVHAS